MNENIQHISEYLAQNRDADKIYLFLEQLLTPTELRNVALRWQLSKMLQDGLSQRKIASELHVSLCKITRGSKELKKEHSVLKEAILLNNN